MFGGMLTIQQAENFFNKVEKDPETGCWVWTAFIHKGYGRIRFGDAMRYAHRVSYQWYTGEDPRGLCVCHHCDNPKCVNPDHLFLGIYQDNMDDMVSKGRHRGGSQPGEKNPSSKLTEERVLKVVGMLPHMNNKQIAAHLKGKVTHSSISNIRRGKTWACLTKIVPTSVRKYSSLRKRS